MTDLTPEDIAAAKAEGDLVAAILAAAGIHTKIPRQQPAAAPEEPCYHIARPGAWPCGTAPSGPSPGPSCPDCATGGTP